MAVENVEETDRVDIEEKEHLDQVISVAETTGQRQTENDDRTKEGHEVTGEESQKDSIAVVLGESKIDKTGKKPASDNAEKKGESDDSNLNGNDIVSEVNEELGTFVRKESTETEGNNKKHPLMFEEGVGEPKTKKSKLEGEQEFNIAESSAWEYPFPSEFYTDMGTYDCDPGPMWHFDDPYFIELAQVGNPPKDVAYVTQKQDKAV